MDTLTPRYSTADFVPHARPYDARYAEKVPLLELFRGACLEHLASRKPGPLIAAEAGVYKGHALVACLNITRDLGVPALIVGLDTFEGLPDLSPADLELAPANAKYRTERRFADTSLEAVSDLIAGAGHRESALLVKGLFGDTFPHLEERTYDFVNIDCDSHAAHTEALAYFYPRVRTGGIVFFDDYWSVHWPQAKIAIDDFMKDKPETLMHLRFGPEAKNHTKAYFLKG